VRWGIVASELGGRLELLVGDALLAAAVVNYMGPFPGQGLIPANLSLCSFCAGLLLRFHKTGLSLWV
jgi:hypothetical protein